MRPSKFKTALLAFVLASCAVFAFLMTFTFASGVRLFYVLFVIAMIPSVLLLLRKDRGSKDGGANNG